MGPMKAAAAILALAFALLQPVSITDCPCWFLCGHKNLIESDQDAALDDCCSRAGEGAGIHRPEPSRDQCLHVEPQTELTRFDVEPPASSWTAEMVSLLAVAPAVETFDRPFESGLSPPARGRPLYLLHASLRI